MLEAAALSDEKFPEWAKNYVLFCHITSKVEGQKNDDLLGKKGGNAFPFVVFMDPDGNVIVKGVERSIAGFEKAGTKAKGIVDRVADLKKKADGGDKAAKIDYALAMMEYATGSTTLDEAKKKIAELGELSKEQKAKSDLILFEVETIATMKTVKQNDKPTRMDAGKHFLEMKKAGRIPQSAETVQPFFILMMDYADDQADGALYEEALKALEKFRADPNTKRFFDARDKRLAELKASKDK